MDRVFFSVAYLMSLPIVVQLLNSVQALPDSSDKLGLVSLTFQTKRRQTSLASAKQTAAKIKFVTGLRVQNYGKPSLYRK